MSQHNPVHFTLCNTSRHVTAELSMIRHTAHMMAWLSTSQNCPSCHDMVRHMAWHGMSKHSSARSGTRHVMSWHGMAQHGSEQSIMAWQGLAHGLDGLSGHGSDDLSHHAMAHGTELFVTSWLSSTWLGTVWHNTAQLGSAKNGLKTAWLSSLFGDQHHSSKGTSAIDR